MSLEKLTNLLLFVAPTMVMFHVKSFALMRLAVMSNSNPVLRNVPTLAYMELYKLGGVGTL